ncbi:hypothetical protein [Natronosalvus rutilus]|uniref:Uncharacterized protein n=1 Tax=Natronosalvus rutilus TaxID=2953753 RepID=A0A9E7NDS1_9EURY|nr:hypothetical protein [Natronosalvus rutilus]UTF55995.1 hypothetical protein NGM29_20625 [Natronosalvus rutilus]
MAMTQEDRDRTDLPDAKLRFDAGDHEDFLVKAIMTLRGLLGIILLVMLLPWTLVTANSIFLETRSVLYLGHWVPVMLAIVAAVYLLGKLYE